jgi:hypothetical protein
MPRKPPAAPAAKAPSRAPRLAAKTAAPAKTAVPAKPVKATAPAKSAMRPVASPKASLKVVVKAAGRALAKGPAKKTAAKAPPRTVAKAPVAAPVAERAPVHDARPALVRDSFTMPEAEYAVLLDVKQACLRAGIDVKKSELLRIGVALLGQLDVATLQGVLAALPQLKTGRPPVQG